eukprot:156298-Amphidinium_carterae.1
MTDQGEWHEADHIFVTRWRTCCAEPHLLCFSPCSRHRAAFYEEATRENVDEDDDVHSRYVQCKFTKEKGLAVENIQGEEMMLGSVFAMFSYLDEAGAITEKDVEWYEYLAKKFGHPPSGDEGWTLRTLIENLGLQFDTFLDCQPQYGACFTCMINPHCPYDTQGYVAHDTNNVVFSFRGSEMKASDWLTNFGIAETSFDPEDKETAQARLRRPPPI